MERAAQALDPAQLRLCLGATFLLVADASGRGTSCFAHDFITYARVLASNFSSTSLPNTWLRVAPAHFPSSAFLCPAVGYSQKNSMYLRVTSLSSGRRREGDPNPRSNIATLECLLKSTCSRSLSTPAVACRAPVVMYDRKEMDLCLNSGSTLLQIHSLCRKINTGLANEHRPSRNEGFALHCRGSVLPY